MPDEFSFFQVYQEICVGILDDILVYSKNLKTHAQHLKEVLEILRENKLYAKLSKCSLAQPQLEYVGHIISSKGVATDPHKITAMVEWPIPTTLTELRAFWA